MTAIPPQRAAIQKDKFRRPRALAIAGLILTAARKAAERGTMAFRPRAALEHYRETLRRFSAAVRIGPAKPICVRNMAMVWADPSAGVGPSANPARPGGRPNANGIPAPSVA